MATYIDQTVAVCDELIAQAQANKRDFGAVFAPVSPAEEKAKVRSELTETSIDEYRAKLETAQARLLKRLTPKQRKIFHRNAFALQKILERENPDLMNDFWETVSLAINLEQRIYYQVAPVLEHKVKEMVNAREISRTQRLQVDCKTPITDEMMIEAILEYAMELQHLKYENYSVSISDASVQLDAQNNPPPIDLLRMRQDIDTVMREAFSDRKKWQKMAGRKPIYTLKASRDDLLYKVMRYYLESSGGPYYGVPGENVELERTENKNYITVKGRAIVQEVLNDGLGLGIELSAPARHR